MKFKDNELIRKEKNFLSQEKAQLLLHDLDQLDYEEINQERYGHYDHVFKSNLDTLPDKSDSYCAKFDMAKNKEDSQQYMDLFEKNIVPSVKKISRDVKYFLKPNIYRIRRGHYFRSHTDAYAGDIGYTYFLSKRWKWDYGGILTFVSEENAANSVFPESNMALFRNEKVRPHHFVSMVPDYVPAELCYYLIVGWAGADDLGESSVRGKYNFYS